MIQLQFRDKMGRTTRVTFYKGGDIKVICFTVFEIESARSYSKDSPIAAMYQRMLADAREVGENLYQVIDAW